MSKPPEKNEIMAWLSDMKQAIQEINDFLPEERNFLVFQKDLKTRRAVERNIEILGEAMNRILKKDPTFHLTDARKIVATRNRVIHGYDSVSEDVIWGIIVKALPVLEKEIDQLLRK